MSETTMIPYPVDERTATVTVADYEHWYMKRVFCFDPASVRLPLSRSNSATSKRSDAGERNSSGGAQHTDPFERLYTGALESQQSKRELMELFVLRRDEERRLAAEAEAKMSFRPHTTTYKALSRPKNVTQTLFEQSKRRTETILARQASSMPTFRPALNDTSKVAPRAVPLWERKPAKTSEPQQAASSAPVTKSRSAAPSDPMAYDQAPKTTHDRLYDLAKSKQERQRAAAPPPKS